MPKTYDDDIDELIKLNREAREIGMYVAFSGPAYIYGNIDPDLPYGIIRNGDGVFYDTLTPGERAEHPLPANYRPGQYRAMVIKD